MGVHGKYTVVLIQHNDIIIIITMYVYRYTTLEVQVHKPAKDERSTRLSEVGVQQLWRAGRGRDRRRVLL